VLNDLIRGDDGESRSRLNEDLLGTKEENEGQ
jgi:hypothetical protein